MRHPSIRGLGVRYLIAALLPISGIVLVVYTVVELAIAEWTHTVPPPRRIEEALLSQDFRPVNQVSTRPSDSAPLPPASR